MPVPTAASIAAETGIPVEALPVAARNAGIPARHGMNGHAHPLGGPGAFPPTVWNAFTRPNAEQHIHRLLALPRQPGLHHAARELGIRHATPAQPSARIFRRVPGGASGRLSAWTQDARHNGHAHPLRESVDGLTRE